MIIEFLSDMEKNYNKHTVYVHNLSSFDSIYLLKIIYSKYKSHTLFKDGKCIFINIFKNIKKDKGKINKFKLNIHDSLLLLPLSLNKLINSFAIKTKKLPFPYKFITEERVKNKYIGEIPSYTYFYNHFDLNKYEQYLKLAVNYSDSNK
jgi:DNA polymerase III delta subunit